MTYSQTSIIHREHTTQLFTVILKSIYRYLVQYLLYSSIDLYYRYITSNNAPQPPAITSNLRLCNPASPPSYDEFVVLHHKTASQERRAIYESRVQKIEAVRSTWYTVGVNHMSDWTDSERSALFGLSKQKVQQATGRSTTQFNEHVHVSDTFPSSWDWSKKGALTPAKNQGTCGSCWSFAGSEAIESALYIATGTLRELSPQAFVDCVPNPDHCGGTGGCEGNTFDLLYSYAANQSATGKGFGGAVLASDYPYTGKDGTCHDGAVATFADVGAFVDVPSNNYTALMAAVMKTPVAVGVAAMNWGDYMGGVYPSTLCDGDIDHAVLLVGWGTDPGLGDYWKIKNSWGTGWGENGYIRLQKDPSFCTFDSKPSDGLGCANTTKKVKVCGACAIQYAPSFPVGVTLAK